jgi:phosphatidylserine decarboxylase
MNIVRGLTRLTSFCIGKFASLELPVWLRRPLFRFYARLTGASLDECACRLEEYQSLQSFFTRELKQGIRTINPPICSPVDGTVSAVGLISGGEILQAKGRPYTLGELLLDGSLAARFEEGSYISIYLCPGDYHRVHSPVSGNVELFKHIPGSLLPVGPTLAKYRDRLFSRNERALVILDNPELGCCAVTLVGALNVGSITLKGTDIKTNRSLSEVFDPSAPTIEYVGNGRSVECGAELGQFQLGSTVIVLLSKNYQFDFGVREGEKVRMGQSLLG